MRVRFRTVAAILLWTSLLRALVPLGYMLELPGGGDGFALALCPLQNPLLDVAAFGAGRGHEHHQHVDDNSHAREASGSGQSPATVSAPNATCHLWLGSLALKFTPCDLHTNFADFASRQSADRRAAPANNRMRIADAIRAPPSLT